MSTTTNGTNPVKMKSSFKLWVIMHSLAAHDELSENCKKRKSTLHLGKYCFISVWVLYLYMCAESQGMWYCGYSKI